MKYVFRKDMQNTLYGYKKNHTRFCRNEMTDFPHRLLQQESLLELYFKGTAWYLKPQEESPGTMVAFITKNGVFTCHLK